MREDGGKCKAYKRTGNEAGEVRHGRVKGT